MKKLRLTKKEKNRLSCNGYRECGYLLNGTPKVEAINKLGQLEDIEDWLGIDLITLFKALKNGIYVKKQSQLKYPLALLRTHYSNHTTKYYVFDNGKQREIKLKDYGKTWALTKEELEK